MCSIGRLDLISVEFARPICRSCR